MFFYEEKNQKTSICLASAYPVRRGPESQKFLVLFFKKERAFLQGFISEAGTQLLGVWVAARIADSAVSNACPN